MYDSLVGTLCGITPEGSLCDSLSVVFGVAPGISSGFGIPIESSFWIPPEVSPRNFFFFFFQGFLLSFHQEFPLLQEFLPGFLPSLLQFLSDYFSEIASRILHESLAGLFQQLNPKGVRFGIPSGVLLRNLLRTCS